ncbi:MAG: hypothetical protein JSV50_12600 [Desulfobacteraceae bacterium]|nr:MAG: hypothetical protein JSV50_12600 [Desulfobacteraceae bacterium]
MRSKKKSKKGKTNRPSLLASEETLVTSLLQDFKTADPSETADRIPDPRLARILIERLPLDDELPVPLLLALDEGFKDKEVHKAVKRVLYRLKKKGVSVESSYLQKESSAPILRQIQKEEHAAYIGPITGTIGSRAVLIVLQRAMKGHHAGIGLVSEAEGIHQFLYTAFSKKRIKEIKDSLSEEAGPLVETSLSHAAAILEVAYQRHLELRSEAPAQYLELRPWLLENITPLNRPIIYDFTPGILDHAGALTDSHLGKLFEHNFMESWLIDFDLLRPFMEDILKVEDSPIVLSEAQKLDRVKKIKEKSIEALFPESKRSLLKHNLEETAYFFFKSDQEEYSAIALTAARTLDEEDTILRKNPVIEFLLERSMDFYMNLVGEKDAEDETLDSETSPRIILP